MHRIAILLAFVSAAPSLADPAKELEARLQKVIDDASKSVVAVTVAHAKYPARFDEKGVGKLGRYEPAQDRQPFVRGPQPAPVVDPLDLRDPATAGDHTFGAGIVLDGDKGLILVPYHLTEGATKIFVRGPGGKGSYANFRAADARCDLAVLQLADAIPGLVAAKLGTVKLTEGTDGSKPNVKRGSFVVAVGYPLSVGQSDGTPSGSWGVLANVRRRSASVPAKSERTTKPLHTYGSLLQTDARLSIGASGSALLNLDGEVIGIASSVAAVTGSEASGGYAIPMDANYRRMIDALAAGKEVEYGFLGVAPDTAPNGVLVKFLTPGCPAADAGVRDGDIILSVDGNPLKESDDLMLHIGAALAGSKVTLKVERGGREKLSFDLTLAKMDNPLSFLATVQPPSMAGLRVDYASVRFAQMGNNQFGPRLVNTPQGVSIRELESGSAAEKKFQEVGDIGRWIVTHVDGKAVATPAAFHAATAGKASVKLTLSDLSSTGKTTTVVLP